MFLMSLDFSSVATSVLSVCSNCASEATVIVSVSAPSSSDTSTRLTCPMVTGTLVRMNSLNPCSETFTS